MSTKKERAAAAAEAEAEANANVNADAANATSAADVEMVESAVQAPDGERTDANLNSTLDTTVTPAGGPSVPVPTPDALADLRAFIENERAMHAPPMLAYRNAEIWCGRNGVEFLGNGKRLLEEIYDGTVNDSMSEFVPNANANASTDANGRVIAK